MAMGGMQVDPYKQYKSGPESDPRFDMHQAGHSGGNPFNDPRDLEAGPRDSEDSEHDMSEMYGHDKRFKNGEPSPGQSPGQFGMQGFDPSEDVHPSRHDVDDSEDDME